MSRLSPVLKWAGGKRQLLSEILPIIPESYDTYFEPFVGAGAVLLALQPRKAVINDTNSELINVYRVIRTAPYELIDLLSEYSKLHSNELYYQIRGKDQNVEEYARMSDLEKAARTIYLNRTCFNGLYRVNKKGFFNTPVGHNSSIRIVDRTGIMGIHEYLCNADIKIMNVDYKECLASVRRNDFVFMDPPYYPLNKDSFVRYDLNLFDTKKQEELRNYCNNLNDKGVRFIETNSDCENIRTLYRDYNLKSAEVRRSINAHVDGRRGTELIITNY